MSSPCNKEESKPHATSNGSTRVLIDDSEDVQVEQDPEGTSRYRNIRTEHVSKEVYHHVFYLSFVQGDSHDTVLSLGLAGSKQSTRHLTRYEELMLPGAKSPLMTTPLHHNRL